MGSPSAPKMPSAMEEARAQMMLEQSRREWEAKQDERKTLLETQRKREEDARLAAENKKTEREKVLADAEAARKGRGLISTGARNSSDYLRSMLSSVAPDLARKYGLTQARDRIMSGYGSLDPKDVTADPHLTLGVEDAWSRAYDTGSNRYRTDTQKALDRFAGDGFETQRFADTMDDDILTEILTQQHNNALEHIKRAQARGQLNEGGYNQALQRIGTRKDAAWGELNDIGMGILNRYRDDLRGMRTNALDTIGKSSLSNTFDLGGFQKNLDSRIGDYSNRLRGDIMKAIGDQEFFDMSSIVSKAGANQGMFNPTAPAASTTDGSNPLLTAFNTQETNNRNPITNRVF